MLFPANTFAHYGQGGGRDIDLDQCVYGIEQASAFARPIAPPLRTSPPARRRRWACRLKQAAVVEAKTSAIAARFGPTSAFRPNLS
jgi:hypothetical protein